VKQKNLWFLTLVFAVTVTLSSSQRIHAGLVAGDSLNAAQSIADTFNSLNAGGGFYFQNINSPGSFPLGVVALENHGSNASADLSVYGINGFPDGVMRTFCVQPDTPIASSGYFMGRLCYENDITHNSNGNILTFGAAYLYTAFVTGELSGYNENDIGNAIRTLMDYPITDNDWTDNPVLVHLYQQTQNKGYWFGVYDPDIYYNEIGYYSVFVMNVVDSNGNSSQDFLYIAALVEPPAGHAPEPATILLWTLGTIGTVGYARRRSRLKKQTG